jgi:hypothetical protein
LGSFKRRLQAAMELNKDGDVARRNNWLSLIVALIKSHNGRKVRGTTFRRDEINDQNYLDFLDQKFNLRDSSMSFNSNSIDARSILSEVWRKKLFQFQPGDKVMITVRAELGGVKDLFKKKSVDGNWSRSVYRVAFAKLKSTITDEMVPGA